MILQAAWLSGEVRDFSLGWVLFCVLFIIIIIIIIIIWRSI